MNIVHHQYNNINNNNKTYTHYTQISLGTLVYFFDVAEVDRKDYPITICLFA